MDQLDIRDDPSWVQPRPKWRKRHLIGGLIIVPLGLVVPFVYFVISSDQALREAIAEADGLDPGWRIPELEQKRAVIPASENSGLVLMAAKSIIGGPAIPGRAQLPPNWPFWDHPQAPEKGARSEEELRNLQEGFRQLEPVVQLDERQTKALREEMRRAEKVLMAVRKVADLPRGRYPITYSKDFVRTLLPYTQEVVPYGNLFGYDALLRAQDGDADGALTSCRGILKCGRSIGDEPTFVSMLVRMVLTALATKRVERTLAQGEPSEAALSRLQREFAAEAEEPLLLIAARGQRGSTDGTMQAIQSGDLDPRLLYALAGGTSTQSFTELFSVYIRYGQIPRSSTRTQDFVELLRIPGMAQRIRAALLKYNNRFVEIAKLPVEDQVQRIKALQAAEQDLPKLARPIVATWSKWTTAFHRSQADLRCAVAMVAVERYRRANNRWPDALTDLVPDYLQKVQLDPFDGSPLRYRRLDDGVVIYSVGADGKDNGGKLENPMKEGTDLGFRLWDVPKRRQPPKLPRQFEGEPGNERD